MSHLQGTDYVGSMVVFEDGLAKRSDYRRFKVKSVAGNDDYAAMEEVLTRRLTALDETPDAPADGRPRRFAYRPNLLAGRRRQGPARRGRAGGARARAARTRSSWPRWPSSSRRSTGRARRTRCACAAGPDALYLLQRVRDEAHRFAITFHRERRGKRMTRERPRRHPRSRADPQGPPGQGAGRRQRGAGGDARGAPGPVLAARRASVSPCTRECARLVGKDGAAVSEFVVVTGMSGAGRSTAAAALEDVGWFVIDNLPAGLIMKMVEMVDRPGSGIERVALVIGRGGSNTGPEYFDDLPDVLDELRATRKRVRVVFLDAPDDVLVRRYEGTRRRHPLAARGRGGVDRRRAPAARAGARAGRPARRHGRAELEPAADAHARGVRRRRGAAHADVGDLVRVQARHPARRRRRLRLPLPAQPVLGRGAAALQRAGRARSATTSWASPSRRPFWRRWTTC